MTAKKQPIKRMKILLTGAAGFIGFHLSRRLASEGYQIVGLDNINSYYSPQLKIDRLKQLGIYLSDNEPFGKISQSEIYPNLSFIRLDLQNNAGIQKLFKKFKFDYVINLAAQAGVRHSLNNPHAYVDSNVTGFLNILEACRNYPVKHLIFASSSSVYGMNETTPFSEKHDVSHPVSLYAATKRTNELMAHSYSHLFNIPVTGLRFFTVYGSWGRPDMAYFSFAEKILNEKAIDIFNYGDLRRDFTYIDDVTEGISKLLTHSPEKSYLPVTEIEKRPDISSSPYRIYNIGNNSPVTIKEFVETLEDVLDCKAVKNFLPMQPGDVYQTYADVENLSEEVGFKPKTDLKIGLFKFAEWYREYYHYSKTEQTAIVSTIKAS